MGQIKNIKLNIVTDIKCKSTFSNPIMTVAVPTVLWAQRADKITVSIQLSDVQDEKIDVTEDNLTFTGKSGGKDYATTIEFKDKVDPNKQKIEKKGREVFCELMKMEQGPFWSALVKDKKKYKNIKVDFSRWKDEDDTDDEAGGPPGSNNDLEAMMQQMGTGDTQFGGGDFDPEEGYEEDSDDDDLPELEGDQS